MAKWQIKRQDKIVGTTNTKKLKQLAASGKLRETDLLQKEGTDLWVRAAKIKGLFEPVVEASVEPKPEATPATNSFQAAASSGARIGVIKTQLAKISNATLPALYRELGEAAATNEEVKKIFQPQRNGIDSVETEIASLKDAKPQQGETLAEKAKLIAAAAADKGKLLLLQNKLKKLHTALGKLAFNSKESLSLPNDLVQEIASQLEQVEQLNAELEPLKQNYAENQSAVLASTGEGIQTAGKSINRFIHSWPVVGAVSLTCCFPAALGLIWTHSTWSSVQRVLWSVGSIGVFGLAMIFGMIQIQQAKNDLAKAHEMWDGGSQAKAVAEYDRLAQNLSVFPDEDQSLMLERAIDHFASSSQNTKAEKLIGLAVKNEVGVDLKNPSARTLLNDLRKRIEKERLTRKEKEKAADTKTQPSEVLDGEGNYIREPNIKIVDDAFLDESKDYGILKSTTARAMVIDRRLGKSWEEIENKYAKDLRHPTDPVPSRFSTLYRTWKLARIGHEQRTGRLD